MNEKDKKDLVGFIPNRLKVEYRPELANFPLNVLFASFKPGKNASALYEPALYSFKEEGEEQNMVYVNKYGKCWLEIIYNKEKGTYVGKKYIDEKLVLESTGADWKGFFFHFTMLGLSDGEACLFDKTEKKD